MLNTLDQIFDRLWPIARSITGPGFAKSLDILREIIPLEAKLVPTGTEVFDWIVPPEWELISAELFTEHGEKVLSTEDSNLHILNFSEPFSGLVSFHELNDHLHSIPELPDAVPYVTSYYSRRWGFCMSENQRQRLDPNINYKVQINTRIYDGFLRYGECYLPGESEDTVLLTSYLCHPSLANNELSGPLVLAGLYDKLKQVNNRYYSYRFVIVPETIGSISFLASSNQEDLKKIKAGMVLTCLGGPAQQINFKHSRRHWLGEETDIDMLVESFCRNDSTYFTQRPFTPTGGSDERQFCSAGLNLPVIQAARTIYGDYPEYHTSLDTKEFMTIESLVDSVEKLFLFLKTLEFNRSPLQSCIEGGEPMLGRRELYPSLNSPTTWLMSSDNALDARQQLNLLLNVNSLVDGSRKIQAIADFMPCSYGSLVPTVEKLVDKKVIRL